MKLHSFVVTLLTKEEYEKYKLFIPILHHWWWLRSPGYNYGDVVYTVGSVDPSGGYVDDDSYAVRPALKSKSIDLPVGNVFSALGNRWVVIDKGIAISDDVITHRRFDSKSNSYAESELKKWLDSWAKEGVELEHAH